MLEDDPVDAELIGGLLRKKQPDIEFTLASTRKEYERALQQSHPDLILADNSVPQFDASDALLYARLRSPDMPFIMVTGTISEEYAVEMIKAGADDYILKDRPARLPAAVEAAINQRQARKNAQEAQEEIRRSNERFQTLSRLTKDAVWDLDLVNNKIWWNESFFQLLGLTDTVVPDMAAWIDRIHPDDREKMDLRLEQIRKGGNISWEDELRLLLPDGNTRTVLDRAYVLKQDGGKPVRLIGVFVDITEKRKLEDEEMKGKIRHQKELTRAILQAVELERNKLGMELHDNINQILSSVNLRLSYYLDEPENNRAILDYCRQGLETAIREMRNLSHRMVMPSLSKKSLRSELALLVEHYTHALPIKLELRKVNERRIPPQIKEALYRIIQEQLSNIHKHAKASQVQVRLSADTGWVALLIIDNGVGFDPKMKRKGIGISNIYHRAESFDGKAEIFSRPGAGCTLAVKIPLVG